MARIYEIPLTADPQKFTVALAGANYGMRLYWCDPAQSWMLDISDEAGAPMVNAIPIVTGLDLLAQYAYLGIAGSLIAQTASDAQAVPTFDNLGTASFLYFVTG